MWEWSRKEGEGANGVDVGWLRAMGRASRRERIVVERKYIFFVFG